MLHRSPQDPVWKFFAKEETPYGNRAVRHGCKVDDTAWKSTLQTVGNPRLTLLEKSLRRFPLDNTISSGGICGIPATSVVTCDDGGRPSTSSQRKDQINQINLVLWCIHLQWIKAKCSHWLLFFLSAQVLQEVTRRNCGRRDAHRQQDTT